MRFCLGAVATAIVVLASRTGAAEPRELRHDTRVDIAVTSTGATWLLLSELLKGSLVPEKCRWCYRADDGGDLLNPYDGWVRHRLRWTDTRAAHLASNVTLGILEPATQLGLTLAGASQAESTKSFALDALLITEATVIAGVLNQVAKFGFARERPFVHYLPRAPGALRELTASPSDDNLSFFSGHTTIAFAMATSSATIATMRGYKLAPLMWGTGLAFGGAVGYLRIAADKHYFSDVMTGAIVGSLVGVAIPLILHSPRDRPSASASAGAQALSKPAARTAVSISGTF
jgi:membrane-associated phospholipid phosphatase